MKCIKVIFFLIIICLTSIIESTEHSPFDGEGYVYLVQASKNTKLARTRPFLDLDNVGNFKQHTFYIRPKADNVSNQTNSSNNDGNYDNNLIHVNKTLYSTTISSLPSSFLSSRMKLNSDLNLNETNNSQPLEAVNFELPSWTLPLVIVAIPTFNRKEFLYQSLEYVKWQQYPRDRIHVAILDDSPISLYEDDDGRFRHIIESLKHVGITLHYKHRILKDNIQENIGQKRNSLVRWIKNDIPMIDERDFIIIHWDDDDWHAPHRIMKQVLPLINGQSKLSALDLRTILILHEQQVYYRWAPEGRNFSNIMPIMSVNGGTLAYWISIYDEKNGLQFPNIACGEDIMFVDRVVNSRHKITILDDSDISVIYTRHKGNTWGGLDPNSWILLKGDALPPKFLEVNDFYKGMQYWNKPHWNGKIKDSEEYWVCSHNIDEVKNLVVNEIRGL